LWIAGDIECITGEPTTPYTRVFGPIASHRYSVFMSAIVTCPARCAAFGQRRERQKRPELLREHARDESASPMQNAIVGFCRC
jgi:hypothetical protein